VNAFGQPPWAAIVSSICFTMPFDEGDFVGGFYLAAFGDPPFLCFTLYLTILTADYADCTEKYGHKFCFDGDCGSSIPLRVKSCATNGNFVGR
jgi:hypothetical protein